MRLVGLAVKNFKAFDGDHLVELPDGGRERPVHLFGGMNGAGKTSVTQAFSLALHGVRAADLPGLFPGGRDARPRYEQWLSAALNHHARERGDWQMQARVVLADDDGRLAVSRSWWFDAAGDFEEEHVEARRESASATELFTGPDAQALVDEALPRNLLDFAVFDGEQVRQLDDTLSAQSVRAALDRLLELEPVERLQRDLARAAAERRVRNADSNQQQAHEGLRRALDEGESELTRAGRAVRAAEREAARLAEESDKVAAAVRARLRGRRSAASTTDAQALTDHRRELRARLGRLIGDALYLLPALPGALPEAGADLAEQRAHLRTAERAKLELETVESLMEQASDDAALRRGVGKGWTALERWLGEGLAARREAADAAGPGPHGDALAEFSDAELADAEAAAASFLSRELADARALAMDLLRIEASLDALAEADAAAGADGDDELELLLRRRDELSRLQGEREASLAARRESLAELIADVGQRRSRLRKLEDRLDLAAEDSAWADAAERAAAALGHFVAARRADAVGGVRERMLDGLRLLLRKQDLVADVTVDPATLVIRLVGRDGADVELPSAAEHQLAAMAFTEAVLASSRSPLPVFVDTPLARLDSAHRAAVVGRFWPSLGRQVLVLSTDEEVVGDLHELVRPHLAGSHLLVNGPDGRTTVVSGGYLLAAAAGTAGHTE